jgi:hypothetical protein
MTVSLRNGSIDSGATVLVERREVNGPENMILVDDARLMMEHANPYSNTFKKIKKLMHEYPWSCRWMNSEEGWMKFI